MRGLIDGNVHLPGDPGYDQARIPRNIAVETGEVVGEQQRQGLRA
jgi:hypothetical protein